MKTLIIVERSNGWYGGYVKTGDGYSQEFNTSKDLLFWSMKNYTDKGYVIQCVNNNTEKELASGKPSMTEYLGSCSPNSQFNRSYTGHPYD